MANITAGARVAAASAQRDTLARSKRIVGACVRAAQRARRASWGRTAGAAIHCFVAHAYVSQWAAVLRAFRVASLWMEIFGEIGAVMIWDTTRGDVARRVTNRRATRPPPTPLL